MPVIPFMSDYGPCGGDQHSLEPPKKSGANCSDAVPTFELSCPKPSVVVGLNFFPKKCTVIKSGRDEDKKYWWIYFWSIGSFFTLKSDEPLPPFIQDGALVDFDWDIRGGASIAKMREVKL